MSIYRWYLTYWFVFSSIECLHHMRARLICRSSIDALLRHWFHLEYTIEQRVVVVIRCLFWCRRSCWAASRISRCQRWCRWDLCWSVIVCVVVVAVVVLVLLLLRCWLDYLQVFFKLFALQLGYQLLLF